MVEKMVEREIKAIQEKKREVEVQEEVVIKKPKEGERAEEGIKLETTSFSFEEIKVKLRKLEERIKTPEVERILLETPPYQEMAEAKFEVKTPTFELSLPSFSGITLSPPSFSFLDLKTFHTREICEGITLPPLQQIALEEPSFSFKPAQRVLEPELLYGVPKTTKSPIVQTEARERAKTLPKIEEVLEEEGGIDLLLDEFPFRLEIGEGEEALTNGAIVIAPRVEDGFEALRKLFILEIRDRGRDPSPLILRKDELNTDKETLLYLMRGHRLISIDGYDKPGDLRDLKDIIKGEVEGEELKYIILRFPPEVMNLSLNDYRKFFGIGRVILVRYKEEFYKEGFFKQITSIFNSDLFYPPGGIERKSLDDLSSIIEGRKDKALEDTLNSLLRDPEILALSNWKRLPGESDEHYAMKLLTGKILLKRGKKVSFESCAEGEGGWEILKVDGRETLSIERPGKRVDINAGDIWAECETLKNLNNPLTELRKKVENILPEILKGQKPVEIWFIFPYRKAVLYGRRLLKPLKILPIRYRVFFADFSNKKLISPSKEGLEA